jgi:hypothetical protein
MQNGLLEELARNELEQQKERISTYQIQARFALASIYDRAAAPPAAAPREAPQESQGELEVVPSDPASPNGALLDGAPLPPADRPAPPIPSPEAPSTEAPAAEAPAPEPSAPADAVSPAVDTSTPPAEAPK